MFRIFSRRYFAISQPFTLALHFLNHHTSVSQSCEIRLNFSKDFNKVACVLFSKLFKQMSHIVHHVLLSVIGLRLWLWIVAHQHSIYKIVRVLRLQWSLFWKRLWKTTPRLHWQKFFISYAHKGSQRYLLISTMSSIVAFIITHLYFVVVFLFQKLVWPKQMIVQCNSVRHRQALNV